MSFPSNNLTVVVAFVTVVFVAYFANLKNRFKAAKPELDKQDFRKFKLVSKTQVNSNSFRFVFVLANPENSLGLGIGQCISIKALVGEKEVTRSYTPISKLDEKGQFELLIKVYPNGAVSSHMKQLNVGDTILVRGPKGNFQYQPNKKEKILMIAGGSGITPMYQVIQEIVRDSNDKTKIDLLYANIASEDILLRTELDRLASKHGDRLTVHYVLQTPPEDWTGSVGYVSKELIEKHIGSPTSNKQVLLCGPPPMIKAMEGNLVELGFEQPGIISKPEHQIFKF
ncbi:hypothetical protein BB559_003348 [Furculomyces boomerangus]|uniref:NADH-cytochrome b5 reductase n=2 Tax=Harpellales TaxID=61421 RepID=A0A2T9YLT9_9FUNG|nr:hypothetical protein BB559_003348 [Furculomyces boomerangus]PVZ96554.1 hypothetical protein BB558_007527 [Smittium angustum]PVZ98282.1 hypothetical protein BB558_005706 [Smittium angustum]